MASLRQRIEIAAKAVVGLYSDTSAKSAYGLLAGIFPGSIGDPPKRGTQEFLQAYSTMPWLRAVTHKVSHACATVKWQLFVAKGAKDPRARRIKSLQRMGDHKSRTLALAKLHRAGELKEIEDHLFLDVLDDANSYLTGLMMRKVTQVYLDLVGEAFWIKERGSIQHPETKRNVVKAVWPIPPTWVISTPTPLRPEYRVQYRGWHGAIPETEILWFQDPDPFNPYGRGSGTAQALADELETDEYTAKMIKQFFYSRARPDVLISSPSMTEPEMRRVEQDWLSKNQGFWRAYKPYFVNREIDVHEFEVNFRSLQMVDLRKFERDAIVTVYGMPPEILGILSSSNRATITSAEYLFARWVLVPRLELMRSILQERLLPEYDERLILHYESPVEEDNEFLVKAMTAMPIQRVNEWRKVQSLDPLSKADGGELFITDPTKVLVEKLEAAPTLEEQQAQEQAARDAEQEDQIELGDAQREDEVQLQQELARIPPPKKPAPGKRAKIVRKLALTDLPEKLEAFAAQLTPLMRQRLLEYLKRFRAVIDPEALEDALVGGDADDVIAALRLDEFEDDAKDVSRALTQIRYEPPTPPPASQVEMPEEPWADEVIESDALEPYLTPISGGSDGEVTFRRDTEDRYRKVEQTARQAYRRGGVDSGTAIREINIQARFDIQHPRSIAWAREFSGQLITNIFDETRAGVQRIIAGALENGIPPKDTARLIREIVGLRPDQVNAVLKFRQSLIAQGVDGEAVERRVARFAQAQLNKRALLIARTEIIAALSMGQDEVWRQGVEDRTINPELVKRVWIATDDDRTDPECARLDGEERALDEPFTSGIMMPPLHPNCLPGETLVASGTPITAQTERWYEGELVVVRTAGGHQLSCTPNHPVLTPTGWMPAALLHEGDYVIRSLRSEWVPGRNDHYDQMPPRIEQVADALRRACEMTAREVPVAPEDFHGDGLGSQIAVVRANLLLGDRFNAALAQQFPHLLLKGCEASQLSSGRRATAQGLEALTASQHRAVRGRDLVPTSLGGHARPLQALGLASAPERNSVALEESGDGGTPDALLASELVHGLAGPVTADQIVWVSRRPFAGHVYNLQTGGGWYIANGIVTHNCRCTLGLVVKSGTRASRAPAIRAPALVGANGH